MTTKFSPISPNSYVCSFCVIKCCRKSEWTRHIKTKKHKNNENGEISNIWPTNVTHICECGKKYKDRGGLWRHKKKCVNLISCENKNIEYIFQKENSETNKDVILSLLKQNNEFKDLIVEQIKMMIELCKEKCTNINLNPPPYDRKR